LWKSASGSKSTATCRRSSDFDPRFALKKSPSAASRRACTMLERSRRIAGRGRKIGHALNSTDEGSNVAERTEADILVHGAALRRTGTERTTAWDAFTLGRLDQHPRRPIPRSRRLLFHVVWRIPLPALITCTSPASVRAWLPSALVRHRAFADVAGAAPEFAPVSLSCSRMNRGGCNFGWHVVRRGQNHVRFLGYSGREMLAVRLSHFDPRRTSHGRTQTSGSGGADLSFPVAAHPLPRISSADNARRDLRRQKTSVQERSSQTRAPSLQNCASGPPKNPYAMRRYRRRSRRGRTIRT
jgi:hypothetical protein